MCIRDRSKIVDTSDEWITSRTGIKERRISEGEDTSQISIKAAKMALERSKLKGEDIDLIVVATITPDMFTPVSYTHLDVYKRQL